jgi:hypothetical protein
VRGCGGNLGRRHVVGLEAYLDRQHIARADVASRVVCLGAELTSPVVSHAHDSALQLVRLAGILADLLRTAAAERPLIELDLLHADAVVEGRRD